MRRYRLWHIILKPIKKQIHWCGFRYNTMIGNKMVEVKICNKIQENSERDFISSLFNVINNVRNVIEIITFLVAGSKCRVDHNFMN